MIYKIKFISEEVDGFFREIEIDSDSTFLDLNKAILKSCGYPDDQMTSFYVCNDEWERGLQITRQDVTDSTDEDVDFLPMERTSLSDFIDDKGQRFEFIFDPFTERSFYLQVKDLITGRHQDEAIVVRQAGTPPQQILDYAADPVIPVSKGGDPLLDTDEDDLFYGDGEFDSEDFDPDGFEISEGRPY